VLPKLTLAGATEICGCTPVPLSGTVSGEFVALLTTLRVPVTLPAVRGPKVTVSATLWPAATATFPGKLLRTNPAPVTVACEIVTLAVPVFVRVMDCDAAVPTNVFPKLRLVGLADSR
jgi:hypothetical protein